MPLVVPSRRLLARLLLIVALGVPPARAGQEKAAGEDQPTSASGAAALLVRLYPDRLPSWPPATFATQPVAAQQDLGFMLANDAPTSTTRVSPASAILTGRIAGVPSPAIPMPAAVSRRPGSPPVRLSVPAPPKAVPTARAVSAPARPETVAINHADAGELRRKLKIDARRARLIIEFRQAYGPFTRLEDLTQVNGINDAMLRAWEERDLIVLD